MNKLDLATLGVEEMSDVQMQEVDGGWLMAALAIGGALIYVYNNWGDFKAGIDAAYN